MIRDMHSQLTRATKHTLRGACRRPLCSHWWPVRCVVYTLYGSLHRFLKILTKSLATGTIDKWSRSSRARCLPNTCQAGLYLVILFPDEDKLVSLVRILSMVLPIGVMDLKLSILFLRFLQHGAGYFVFSRSSLLPCNKMKLTLVHVSIYCPLPQKNQEHVDWRLFSRLLEKTNY
jgi:hypothetical protein